MAQFPSSIISFSTKVNGQIIDASHIDDLQNEVTALETKVGADGSADATSLDYIIKNAGSNGGGHVQTANKGGTGQTSYTKGDLLVASSSSVIGKLSAGVDNQVLQADSSQTTGLKWSNVIASKVNISILPTSYSNGASSVANVLFASSILGSVLGTNNAIRFTGTIDKLTLDGNKSNTFNLQYGNQSVASFQVSGGAGSIVGATGTISGMIIGNGASNDQKGYMSLQVGNPNGDVEYHQQVALRYGIGSSSVNSSANQNLIITTQTNWTNGTITSVLGTIFVVEKIV
jgi:hypothetical protein